MKYNFDKLANRRNTNSYKWDVKEGELPMWVADMDFETLPEVKEALLKRVNIGAFGYSFVPEEFFNVIIKWWEKRHHVTFKREWMIYSSGVVAAISSMVRRLTSAGDNVIIQPPVYNIFYNSILNNKRKVLENKLIRKKDGYCIDFEDLEKKMSFPETTLMILCNPHNPIGHIWSKEDLHKIGSLAKKYHVYVISDEIHCDIATPGKGYNPFIFANEDNKDISITCVASSKVFNLAGLQSACLIIPDEALRNNVNRGLNNDEVAEPNFFSMDANIAAFKCGEEWVDELNEYIYQNKLLFIDYVKKNLPHLDIVYGDATYLVWVDISFYSHDSVSFTKSLREKTGLFVSDGREYGENGDCFFRINLATSKDNVIDACHRLSDYIESLEE